MLASLKIEAIGDNAVQSSRFFRSLFNDLLPGSGDAAIGSFPSRYFVAEITGVSKKFKWDRRFLRGNKDYARSNSSGSRGIFIYYTLESGKIYEVKEPASWKSFDRYFCYVNSSGDIIKILESEILEWLTRNH